jgi:hypothetical protein
MPKAPPSHPSGSARGYVEEDRSEAPFSDEDEFVSCIDPSEVPSSGEEREPSKKKKKTRRGGKSYAKQKRTEICHEREYEEQQAWEAWERQQQREAQYYAETAGRWVFVEYKPTRQRSWQEEWDQQSSYYKNWSHKHYREEARPSQASARSGASSSSSSAKAPPFGSSAEHKERQKVLLKPAPWFLPVGGLTYGDRDPLDPFCHFKPVLGLEYRYEDLSSPLDRPLDPRSQAASALIGLTNLHPQIFEKFSWNKTTSACSLKRLKKKRCFTNNCFFSRS